MKSMDKSDCKSVVKNILCIKRKGKVTKLSRECLCMKNMGKVTVNGKAIAWV